MKTLEVKYIDTQDLTLKIDYDQDAEDPRDWDNLGTMVLSHKNYRFAKEAEIDFNDFDSWDEVEQHLIKEHQAEIILPVQMYEHSGISIYVGNTHDRWDGGQLGYIFVTADTIRKEYQAKRITKKLRELVVDVLTSEVDTYSKYANGDCYQWTLKDARGEIIDGCSGYYSVEDIENEFESKNYVYENLTIKYPWED